MPPVPPFQQFLQQTQQQQQWYRRQQEGYHWLQQQRLQQQRLQQQRLQQQKSMMEKKYRIWYYCNVCSGEITMHPNGNDHKALIEYMKEYGWGHTKCHKSPIAVRTKTGRYDIIGLQDDPVTRSMYRIWYYCAVCTDEITIYPNSDAHKALIKYMKEKGWGHSICPTNIQKKFQWSSTAFPRLR